MFKSGAGRVSVKMRSASIYLLLRCQETDCSSWSRVRRGARGVQNSVKGCRKRQPTSWKQALCCSFAVVIKGKRLFRSTFHWHEFEQWTKPIIVSECTRHSCNEYSERNLILRPAFLTARAGTRPSPEFTSYHSSGKEGTTCPSTPPTQ